MPIVDIPDRVCSHCGGTKWARKKNNGGYITYVCVAKRNEYVNRYKDKNRALINERAKKYRKEHPVISARRKHVWTTEVKNYRLYKETFSGRVAIMATAQFFGVPSTQLTQEQIEQYREYIKTLRLWRQSRANNS